VRNAVAELKGRGEGGREGLKVLLQLAYKINNFFVLRQLQRRKEQKTAGQGHSFNMNLHVRLTMAAAAAVAQDFQGIPPAILRILGSLFSSFFVLHN